MADPNVNELRERVAVTEATLKAHDEMLKEMRDAVKGIDSSLHSLTRLEERAVNHHEQQSYTRKMLLEESQERKVQIEEVSRRINDIELLLSDLDGKTVLNSHGRDLWERYMPIIVAAVIGPVITVGLALLFLKDAGAPVP